MVKAAMMALRRLALVGAGALAATRPPAWRMAVRADRTARGRRGQSARVGPARELPPQRVVGRPPALLCGGGGPCRGHTAAPMALRRRCARRRAAECACRTAGSVGFELGWMLGAFRRRPRPSLLGILFSVDIARCVARRRFSGSRRRSRPRLPRIF